MKNLKLSLIVLAVFCLVSCSDKVEVKGVYGNTLIYMPQATHNLGTDNNLNLEISIAKVTANPEKHTQTTLGIYRSGTAAKESATVDLTIDRDTLGVAHEIAMGENPPAKYDIHKTGKLLEAKYYSPLPETLTIKDGYREATTQLVLNDKAIVDDNAEGSILLLPVRIANPTKYSLNYSLSCTMVVITIKE